MGEDRDSSEIRSHRDLIVWQRGIALVELVYRVTSGFPDAERFGLVSQLRRAAVSIPSNIAEGYGRGTSQDYLRFLRVARGSLFEVDTQVLIASRLGYVDERTLADMHDQLNEVGRVLAGLIKSIDDRITNP